MSLFNDALKLILSYEGGYVNDKNDHGGATNYGVTQRVYDAYRKTNKKGTLVGVKDITMEEVEDIYFSEYWLQAKCDKLPPHLAIVVFDTAVNSGVGRASKFLQRVVGASEDGIIGKGTLALVATACTPDDMAVTNKYIDIKIQFYKDIVERDGTQVKFLKGWLNRANNLRKFILTAKV